MSSPSTHKVADAQPSSPQSLSETPRPEPRVCTRRAPVDFGARLADARGLRPQDAPPAPPPRTADALSATQAVVMPSGGNSLLSPGSAQVVGTDTIVGAVPRYGGTKGSYISSYDIGGQHPGSRHLSGCSTMHAVFEAKYGASARRHFNARVDSTDSAAPDHAVAPATDRFNTLRTMKPVQLSEKAQAPIGVKGEERVVHVPEDVSTFAHVAPFFQDLRLTQRRPQSKPSCLDLCA
jgi:hypothetical protein